MDLQGRLVVYSGDDFVGILPTPTSINWGAPINDTPTIQFSYSALDGVPGGDLVKELTDQQYDVAIELNWGDGWAEPRSGRFIVMDSKNDPSDPQKLYNFVGIGVDDDTKGVVVTDHSVYDADGKRTFTAATPGQILETFHDYGQANGMLEFLTNDFTVDATSDQQEVAHWQSTISISFPKETTYRSAIDTLVAYGLINWCCEGNVLRVFNDGADGTVSDYDGMQVDRTDGATPVELIMGRECLDGPQQISRRNMATDAWVLGDNNSDWLRTKTDTFIRRGKRVITISQGGANEGLAAIVGDSSLDVAAVQREQLTRTLSFDTAKFLPWKNYRPGDWVFAPGKSNGHVERLRVSQITLVFSAGAATSGSVVLNDRIYERSIAQQKQIDALSNGAAIIGGTGSAKTPPPKRKPAKPGGGTSYPSVSGTAYVDNSGHIRAVINVTWPGVSSGVDGQAIEIDHYEVRIRKSKN